MYCGPCCVWLSPRAPGPKMASPSALSAALAAITANSGAPLRALRAIRAVSGHNGEQWSAIAGGLGYLLELGDTVSAEEAQAAIEAEIDREQAVFDECAAERDAELD